MKNKIIGAGILTTIILLAALPSNANNNISIENAIKIAVDTLMSREGIVGISYNEINSKISVYIENEEYRSLIPEEIKGFETEIVVSGRMYALGLNEPKSNVQSVELSYETFPPLPLKSRMSHWDPLIGGISFGNKYATGTLGVVDSHNYLVSCAHVIAMNDYCNFVPRYITAVYQPGPDDPNPQWVGILWNYIPLRFGQQSINNPNKADAAIAAPRIIQDVTVKEVLGSDNTNTYTVSLTTTSPSVGQMVRKSGRTTQVTQNTVYATSGTFDVDYGYKWARFSDVLVVNQPFSDGGDSGSFVDRNGNFVGLLFAGSITHTLVCKGSYIKSGLGIS